MQRMHARIVYKDLCIYEFLFASRVNFEVKLSSCSVTWSVPVLYARRCPAVSASYVCSAVQAADIFTSVSRCIIACNGKSDQYFRIQLCGF